MSKKETEAAAAVVVAAAEALKSSSSAYTYNGEDLVVRPFCDATKTHGRLFIIHSAHACIGHY